MDRVLVIDDDGSVRIALRLLLEGLGCSVVEAGNGRDGLDAAHRDRPNLILCDLDMPVMDGFETLRQIRRDPALCQVPVIVVSGLITRKSEEQVTSLGANAILRKPFSFDLLASLVRRLLPGTKSIGDPGTQQV